MNYIIIFRRFIDLKSIFQKFSAGAETERWQAYRIMKMIRNAILWILLIFLSFFKVMTWLKEAECAKLRLATDTLGQLDLDAAKTAENARNCCIQ